MKNDRFTRLFLTILLTVLLLSVYIWAFITRSQPLAIWLAVSGLLLVLLLSTTVHGIAGIIAGLILGYAGASQLYFPDIALWPPTLPALTAVLRMPALFYWLLHLAAALVTAFSAGFLYRERLKLTRQNNQLEEHNRQLDQRIRSQEETLRALSDKRIYRQSLWQQLAPAADQEQIVGALITTTYEKIRAAQRRLLLEPKTQSDLADDQPFFQLLLQIHPELVAILDLNGSIIITNPCLMAIYGYPADLQAQGRHFTDFLLPAELPRAADNIKRAIHGDLDQTQSYAMRSAAGSFRTLIIDPCVSLSCAGDPLVILVLARKATPSEGEMTKPALGELVHGPVWCLSAEGSTLYASPQVAEALGEQAHLMPGKRAERYISRKQLSLFHQFFKSTRDGQPHQIDLTMQPHGDIHTTFRLKAWPALAETGILNGLTLQIEDISDRKAIEDTLSHQLKMEQMISDISKRFISVRVEDMDTAIEDVLKMIGTSENAIESSAEIFRSKAIKTPVRYHVRHEQSVPVPDQIGDDQFETVSVPITIEDERLGYFHFSVRKYQSSWLEHDLPLIRLIGEILTSALIRREHELHIRINEERLSTTLQSIGDAVIATDTAGLIINMNRAAEKLTRNSRV